MSQETGKYRLLTRSDFDGLVSAILLKQLGILEEVCFVHPKDMQDGKIKVNDRDILTNLPYVSGCHLCFDHHASEEVRVHGSSETNHILDPRADSAARVVFNHFGGAASFPNFNVEMLEAADKADAARFTKNEILNPKGWNLLSFVMDPRTGLGRFKSFRVSNYQLMMDLIDYCQTHTIDEILNLADVKERVGFYMSHRERFRDQIQRCATVHGNLVVLDLRNEESIFVGNRFLIYALFPECDISMHVMWGFNRQNTVFAIGKSILKHTNRTDVGGLTLKYGGGGHDAAGTCQIPHDQAGRVAKELIAKINADSRQEPIREAEFDLLQYLSFPVL